MSLWQSMRLDSNRRHSRSRLSSGGSRNHGGNAHYYVMVSLAFQLCHRLSADTKTRLAALHTNLEPQLRGSREWVNKALRKNDPEWDVWKASRVMQLGARNVNP